MLLGLTTESALKGQYVWKIENYSKLPERVESDVFEIGGYQWNLLMFPQGNQSTKNQHMSLYLAVAKFPGEDQDDMQRGAQFVLTVIRQKEGGDHGVLPPKDARHTFTADANDWGFTSFAPLHMLLDPGNGYCVDDTVIIKVDVTVGIYDDPYPMDSRKETGFVGLRNQGATCYMNSLLQTLYNINEFRKAVYGLPTSEDERPSESMPLALQSVFHMLQFTDGPVSTKDLTSSFGWDTMDAFQQHDVQELNRILCDRLEEKMKGTKVEGTINKLFEGQFTNYIECINIDYKSIRKEAFQDLQVVVKGCKNIYDSFDEYCQVEVLDGENQYEAEGHGKQDARKGGLFESMPPVLNLQLRRFEFDFERMMMVKVNDRHEFYSEIDLDVVDPDTGALKYFSSTADKAVRNKYKLLAVLVHSGGIHGGHYYAFIRPDGTNWIRFDDETVTKATEEQAIQENWGTPEASAKPFGNQNRVRFSNAYMLVYVRESEWDSIMCDVTEDDISEHIRTRLRAEEEEKERRRKERAEAHLYTMVSVATDQDLKRQIGSSVFFDLVDTPSIDISLKLPKKAKFSEVQSAVTEKTGIAAGDQRFWEFINRDNGTKRPQNVLSVTDQSLISDLKGVRAMRQGETTKVNLYLEKLPPEDVRVPLGDTTMCVFFKKYTPDNGSQKPTLEYVKQTILSRTMKFSHMVPTIKAICDIPEDQECEMYDEIRSSPQVMVEKIDVDSTAEDLNISDGDIIIVQSVCANDEAEFPTVRHFLADVKNRAEVIFKPLSPSSDKEDRENTFEITLCRNSPYDDVSKAVAEHLSLDHPLKIQFTGQSAFSSVPRTQPINYNQAYSLIDMCKSGFVLYYDIIDKPLPEFEKLVTHKVVLHDSKHDEMTSVTVTIPKDNTVQQLLDQVKEKAGEKIGADDVLRIMEIYQWQIWQVFDPKLLVEEYLESNTGHLRVEVVPDHQHDLDQEGRLHVQCLQVEEKENRPNQAYPFSDPFIMDISSSETVGELKERVQKEMQVSDEDFASWKVVLVTSLMSMEPLQDDVVIADKIVDTGADKLYGRHSRAVIGFWHENKNPRRTHAHIHRPSGGYRGHERALKIKM